MKTPIKLYQSVSFFILFTLSFLVTGYYLQIRNSEKYTKEAHESLHQHLKWETNELIELSDLINLDASSYELIDLRPRGDYLKAHLENAKSFPAIDFLKQDQMDLVNGNKLIVLYGVDVNQALQTYLQLKDLGAEDLRILSVKSIETNTLEPIQSYKVESSSNFAERFTIAQHPPKKKKQIKKSVPVQKEKVSTTPKRKKRLPEGGC